MECDVAIIGGGIVGLAAAWQLGRRYDCRVLVLEKESSVATHQSGRNSGVLHSGIYYQPRSKQAQTCLRGRRLMEEFCRTNDLPFELCGKVIIGSSPRELARLYTLYEWGRANDVQCQIIDRDALLEREPYSAGSKALLVRDAGIVDYPGVVRCLMSLAQEQGTDVLTNSYVHGAHEESQHIILETDNLTVHARHVLNCAGLYADRVAKLLGQEPIFVYYRSEGSITNSYPDSTATISFIPREMTRPLPWRTCNPYDRRSRTLWPKRRTGIIPGGIQTLHSCTRRHPGYSSLAWKLASRTLIVANWHTGNSAKPQQKVLFARITTPDSRS